MSWRKIAPERPLRHPLFEATIALPLMVSALAEKKAYQGRTLPALDWEWQGAEVRSKR